MRDRKEKLRKFRGITAVVFVASLLTAGVRIDLTVASSITTAGGIQLKRTQLPTESTGSGRTAKFRFFKFVTKNTIEEHIHDLIEKKRTLRIDHRSLGPISATRKYVPYIFFCRFSTSADFFAARPNHHLSQSSSEKNT